jgi:hypothetical protein
VCRPDIPHLLPYLVLLCFGRIAILEELDDGEDLVGVLLLFGAGNTVVVQNLLPFLRHPGVYHTLALGNMGDG